MKYAFMVLIVLAVLVPYAVISPDTPGEWTLYAAVSVVASLAAELGRRKALHS